MQLVALALSLFSIALFSCFIAYFISMMMSDVLGAPFVPLKRSWVLPVLKFAELRPSEALVDLGCGDGRVLRAAANITTGRLYGYEFAPWPYIKVKILTWHYRTPRVTIQRKNFFKTDLANAKLIYAYLSPKLIDRVATKIEKECRAGTRLVSPRFAVDMKKHSGMRKIKEGIVETIPVYLYELGK